MGMKFVLFSYDTVMPSLERLLQDGHELLGIFTFECDNVFNFNRECIALAKQLNIPVILSPAEVFHLENFIAQGAELFLAAGYPYKIPPIDESRARAVNIHPAILPNARGFMPIPHVIMDDMKDAAGITAHKMTEKFDAGDILKTEKIKLDDHETVESYGAKLSIISPDFFSGLFKNLDTLWNKAKPQNEHKAKWLKLPTDQTRTLDWSKTIKEIDKTGRAFGRFGVLAPLNEEELLIVYHYDMWKEAHKHAPGEVIIRQPKSITIAVKDGFICLKDFQRAA